MDQGDMWKAQDEAERFVRRVQEFSTHENENDGRTHADHYQCQYHAAVLRASLDLTRALARLRTRP